MLLSETFAFKALPRCNIRSGIEAAAWLSLFVLIALSTWARDLLVDQAQMLNLAAQFLDGRTLYRDVPDAHLPATVLIFSIPNLLARLAHIPAILAFNLFVSSATVLCALAAARFAVGRVAPAIAAGLVTIALLAQNDATFGQRDSLFHTIWLTYLVARLIPPPEAKHLAFVIGLLTGLLTAVKPHFLLYAVVAESCLLVWTRNIFHPALFGAVISGIGVLLALFLFFDWQIYLEIVGSAAAYYRIVGHPPATVLTNMSHALALQTSVCLIISCFIWWIWRRRVPRLAILLFSTALVTVPLVVQQGEARANYFIGITLPALMLGVMILGEIFGNWTAPGGYIGRGRAATEKSSAIGPAVFCIIVIALQFWVTSDRYVGLTSLAWDRFVNGKTVPLFGPPPTDAFLEDWKRRAAAGDMFSVLSAQYGLTAFDPLVSAVRAGRTLYNRYNGIELAFLYALVDGNPQAIDRACQGIANDLAFGHGNWLYIRRDVPPWAKAGDFNEQILSAPKCSETIRSHYREVARFDRYVVYSLMNNRAQ